MKPPLSRDTRLCISLAARPGNFGTRFHNLLYAELGLDYLYKACTTDDIAAAIAGVRALGIRGCSVSMPFKRDVLTLVDEVEASARVITAANTIVNDDGHLVASNTDYLAVRHLVTEHRLDTAAPVALRGSGGMAHAVGTALRDAGFTDGTVVARTAAAGRELADRLGWRYTAEEGADAGLLVNATPVGMAGGPHAHDLAFGARALAAATTVFDVVAMPVETPLVLAAHAAGKEVISGAQVAALQAAEQFQRYTGVRPTTDQVARAAAAREQGPQPAR